MSEAPDAFEPEPRWQPLIAILAIGALYVALPKNLMIGPRLVFPASIGVLLVPLVFSYLFGWYRVNHALGVTMASVLTVAVIASLCLLIAALLADAESGPDLLRSAALLWGANILVFALWYWRLDAGGPNERDQRAEHTGGAFLFPQMTLSKDEARGRWAPQFVDYLFLAFNTSTAFSPTDTPVLTRWGKILMMVQSTISLAVLVLLAARAVNIIRSPP
jgi:hypothetical protein